MPCKDHYILRSSLLQDMNTTASPLPRLENIQGTSSGHPNSHEVNIIFLARSEKHLDNEAFLHSVPLLVPILSASDPLDVRSLFLRTRKQL